MMPPGSERAMPILFSPTSNDNIRAIIESSTAIMPLQ
jgi:hypothetical protein